MTTNANEGPHLHEDFEDFFEGSLIGYQSADAKGRIIRVNRRLAAWLEYSPDEMKGRRFSDYLSIGGKVYYETHLSPLLRMQGHFDEVALDLASKSGKRFPVLVNALERRDEAGDPLFIRISVIKATDRRQYEQDLLHARTAAVNASNELRAMNSLLGQRVADEVRERLALEGNLDDERQMSGLREQFIAVLGHDLRNPLAAIDGGVRLLMKTPLDPKATMLTEMMRSSIQRMANIIENVMDFARGRLGGGLGLRLQNVELGAVLLHVVDELRLAWPERIIETEVVLTSSVECDPGRLSQLLSNLLANALTHGAADGVVNMHAIQDAKSLELSVANTGAPIPAAAIERLFQPFARADVTPSQQGLGLGLYIAAEIARAHGGELTVASSEKETRFTFRMPLGLSASRS